MSVLREVKIREYNHVSVYALVPRDKDNEYARSYPSDAKYMLEIDFKGKIHTHISPRDKNKNNANSMFVCILMELQRLCGKNGVMCGNFEPSDLDCELCRFKCRFGSMSSSVEYGRFVCYTCVKCGSNFDYYPFGSPCPTCGADKDSVISLTKGYPHIHGKFWVFELHVLDHDVAVTLGEFLGVRFDDMMRFSCKGSWHNFRNDSSGFDICHVNCLDNLIRERVETGLTGQELFMRLYPEEGKVLNGNNKIIKYWKNSELKDVSEYFDSHRSNSEHI